MECGATQERSAGWVPPRGEAHHPLAEAVGAPVLAFGDATAGRSAVMQRARACGRWREAMITEAVIKIGEDRMEEIAPAIPARAIRGLGNVLRHEYDSIDLRYILITIQRDLPPLRAACIAALKDFP